MAEEQDSQELPPDEEDPEDDDRRREKRFPAVGITLLYSPNDSDCVPNTGELVREATAYDMSLTGLSFDVREPLAGGEELYIQIEDPAGGPAEQVLAEVKWCRRVDYGHFRIGTKIRATRSGPTADEEPLTRPVGRGPAVPSGAELRCPSCRAVTTLSFIGLQSGPWEKGVMPLYQCSACDSSRTIAAILAHNRDRTLARRRSKRAARKRRKS